ncbi:DUF2243 domain-containing protein [Neorhizobium sp. LjRoot104]|uniref:DUF2243 domain-containing protein n=1 Tax=Neorhizobium sp. LjRoot104 TaxID=3342254 RepID=UPI003F4FCD12
MRGAGLALGFGLGGFFDGILLHQVLQWHHLLSGLDLAGRDVRFLIMTDGLFHVLMYVITGAGLWLLWRSRSGLSKPQAGLGLHAHALIGFGTWHIIDALLSHWLLGLHRIRMDVETPLIWDLVWFGVFGLAPLLIGLKIHRKSASNRMMSSPLALMLAALIGGASAATPAPQGRAIMVMFRPDIATAEAMAAVQKMNAEPLWTDASGQVWAVELPPDTLPNAFYRYGALFVSSSMLPVGCFRWVQA